RFARFDQNLCQQAVTRRILFVASVEGRLIQGPTSVKLKTIAPRHPPLPDLQRGQSHDPGVGESSGKVLHEELALRRGEEADTLFSPEARHLDIDEIRQDSLNLGPRLEINARDRPLTLHCFQATAELPLARDR